MIENQNRFVLQFNKDNYYIKDIKNNKPIKSLTKITILLNKFNNMLEALKEVLNDE